MKKHNIERVAEALETHGVKKLGYNQNTYLNSYREYEDRSGHSCGTVACVAGWTVHVLLGAKALRRANGGTLHNDVRMSPVADLAQHLLGITDTQADRLFVGSPDELPDPTSRQAARVLRRLVATNRVDWGWAGRED